MPELPEVETTRRGIAPHLTQARIKAVTVRDHRLRWPIPRNLAATLEGAIVTGVRRRAKYLLFDTSHGCLLVHLGMSGSLRLVGAGEQPRRHDHVDIRFDHGLTLRYHDPRRFGCILWAGSEPFDHPLLTRLGVEPLQEAFRGDYLYERSRGRRLAVKPFLMDSHIVVGVGNIYANEALFMAGIRPSRAAGRIALVRYRRLAEAVREVLQRAIESGGTTLRDFVNGDGNPGYFRQRLNVYARSGEPCRRCGTALRLSREQQRATFFCPFCQR